MAEPCVSLMLAEIDLICEVKHCNKSSVNAR